MSEKAYLIFILLIFIYYICYRIFLKENNKIFITMMTLHFGLLVALRNVSYVGVDMIRYERHYNNVSEMSMLQSIFYSNDSWGYYFLNYLFGKLGVSFQIFISLVSMLCVFSFGWYIYKYSKSPIISFFVYLGLGGYTFLFSGIRQSIAMAIILIAVDKFITKKYIKSFFYIIVAFLFHPTAIVVIPCLLLSKIRVTPKILIIYITSIIIMIIYRNQIGRAITKLFNDEYIDKYVSKGELGGTYLLIGFIILIFTYINYKSIIDCSERNQFLFHLLIYTLLIQTGASYAYSFTRLNLYFMILLIPIVVPDILTYFKQFKSKALPFCLSYAAKLGCASLMIVQFNSHIIGEFIQNYYFIWE